MPLPGDGPTGARALTLALSLALIASVGCSDGGTPSPAPVDTTDGTSDGLAEFDPTGDALLEQLDVLETTVVAARDALREASTSSDAAATRAALTRARSLLLAESARTDPPLALLPATAAERDTSSARPDDLLTATATLAGDDVSPRARTVLELLRDPIAGDLGAWLRDAEGVVALVREVAAEALEAGEALDTAELAVRGLDGEATRALAWTFASLAALDSGRTELAAAHAARGAAHLEVVRVGIGLAREALLGAATPDATGGALRAPDEDDGTSTDGTDGTDDGATSRSDA